MVRGAELGEGVCGGELGEGVREGTDLQNGDKYPWRYQVYESTFITNKFQVIP